MNNDEYLSALAEFRSRGEWQRAYQLSEQQLERTGNPIVLVHMCVTLLRSGDREKLLAELQRLETLYPDRMASPRFKAMYAEATDDLIGSVTYWRQLTVTQPNKPESYIRLLDLYQRQDRYIELLDCMEQFEKHCDNHPKLGVAKAALQKKLAAHAILDGQLAAAELRSRAAALTGEHKWEEARAAWETLFLLAPTAHEAVLRICDCLNEQERFEEAIGILADRIDVLKQQRGLADTLRRTVRGLAAAGANPELFLKDDVLDWLSAPVLQAVLRSLAGDKANDAFLVAFVEHLVNRGDPELLKLLSRQCLDVGRPEHALALAQALMKDQSTPGDGALLGLEAAWQLGDTDAAASIAVSLQSAPEQILSEIDRFVLYATNHFRLFGADAFLQALTRSAPSATLAGRGRALTAMHRFAREGATGMIALLGDVSGAADTATHNEILLGVGIYSDGTQAHPEWVDERTATAASAWLAVPGSGDEPQLLAIAQHLVQSDRWLLLEQILAYVPRTAGEDAKLTRVRAVLATRRNAWESAAELWTDVATRNPHDRWAEFNQLNALIRIGRDQEARATFEKLMSVEAGLDAAMRADLAICAARMGDIETATALAHRVIEEGPVEQFADYRRLQLARLFCVAGHAETAWRLYDDSGMDAIDAAAPLAVILDPGLNVSSGHHSNYNLFAWKMVEELVAGGADLAPVILCREKTETGDDLAGLRLARNLKFEPYALDDVCSPDLHLPQINDFFRYDLARLRVEGRVGLVYMHSMRGLMIEGFSRWIDDVFATTPGTVVVGLIEVDHLTEQGGVLENYVDIYRRGLTRLVANDAIRLVVYVETEVGREFLTGLAIPGLRVRVYPYLAASLCMAYASDREPADDAPIRFGVMGGTRQAKGSHLIPRLIAQTQDLAADCRWIAHINARMLLPITPIEDLEFIQRLSSYENAEIVDRVLSVEEYFGCLDRTDVVLLPYQDRYAVSGSGILYEAIYMGKFLVVPRDTFMPAVLQALGHPHLVIEQASAECLEAAVRSLVRGQGKIKRELASLRSGKRRALPSEEFQAVVREALG